VRYTRLPSHNTGAYMHCRERSLSSNSHLFTLEAVVELPFSCLPGKFGKLPFSWAQARAEKLYCCHRDVVLHRRTGLSYIGRRPAGMKGIYSGYLISFVCYLKESDIDFQSYTKSWLLRLSFR
jgi:hypothetical protein